MHIAHCQMVCFKSDICYSVMSGFGSMSIGWLIRVRVMLSVI